MWATPGAQSLGEPFWGTYRQKPKRGHLLRKLWPVLHGRTSVFVAVGLDACFYALDHEFLVGALAHGLHMHHVAGLSSKLRVQVGESFCFLRTPCQHVGREPYGCMARVELYAPRHRLNADPYRAFVASKKTRK